MLDDTTRIITDYRIISVDDIPWVLSLAYKRYRPFDPGATLIWLARILQSPGALAIRTDHAFVIVNVVTGTWQPDEREAHVMFCCTAGDRYVWEAVRMLKHAINWARRQRCRKLWISSETESSVDALAKRIGAKPEVVRYSLDLKPRLNG